MTFDNVLPIIKAFFFVGWASGLWSIFLRSKKYKDFSSLFAEFIIMIIISPIIAVMTPVVACAFIPLIIYKAFNDRAGFPTNL